MNLYYWEKTRASRPRWVLEELEIPYDLVPVDLKKGEQKSEAFRALSPFGWVPALEDGDVKLFESGAICLYLANKYGVGKIAPAVDSPEYPLYLQWAMFATSSLERPVIDYWEHTTRFEAIDRVMSVAQLSLERFTKMAEVLSVELADRDTILKSGFSVADVLLCSMIAFARAIKMTANFPRLNEYVSLHSKRPAYQRSRKD